MIISHASCTRHRRTDEGERLSLTHPSFRFAA